MKWRRSVGRIPSSEIEESGRGGGEDVEEAGGRGRGGMGERAGRHGREGGARGPGEGGREWVERGGQGSERWRGHRRPNSEIGDIRVAAREGCSRSRRKRRSPPQSVRAKIGAWAWAIYAGSRKTKKGPRVWGLCTTEGFPYGG